MVLPISDIPCKNNYNITYFDHVSVYQNSMSNAVCAIGMYLHGFERRILPDYSKRSLLGE